MERVEKRFGWYWSRVNERKRTDPPSLLKCFHSFTTWSVRARKSRMAHFNTQEVVYRPSCGRTRDESVAWCPSYCGTGARLCVPGRNSFRPGWRPIRFEQLTGPEAETDKDRDSLLYPAWWGRATICQIRRASGGDTCHWNRAKKKSCVSV